MKTALRYFLGFILLGTGVGKLLDVPGFIVVINTYQALTGKIVPVVAVLVILIELRIAEALLLGNRVRMAALASTFLHIAFFCWALIALLREIPIPNCGCFGVFLARPLTYTTLIEDGVMVAVSYVLFTRSRVDTPSLMQGE